MLLIIWPVLNSSLSKIALAVTPSDYDGNIKCAITHWHGFKEDSESQWKNHKMGNLTPRSSKPTEPIVNKIGMGDYVAEIHLCAKFQLIRLGVIAPQICENAHQSDLSRNDTP